jgi:hypothetical protein
VGVEYMGSTVYSDSRAIPSLQAAPQMVVRPRVKLLKAKSAVDPAKNTPLVRLRIFWSPPHANGYPVEKYQLQVKEELDLDLVGPETFSRAPIAGGHGGGHGEGLSGEEGEHDLGMIGRVPQSVWPCRISIAMSYAHPLRLFIVPGYIYIDAPSNSPTSTQPLSTPISQFPSWPPLTINDQPLTTRPK